MKIYKTQAEVEKDIVNGVLIVEDDVMFECDITIEASINAKNINAWDINAWDINAKNINAWDINAWDINAWDINAKNINAWDINAFNITAWNILYDAFCCVYQSITCTSIEAKRKQHHPPICLDGTLTFKPKEQEVTEMTVKDICKALGKTIKIIE